MSQLSVLEPSLLAVQGTQLADEANLAAFEQRWIDLLDTIRDSNAAGLDYMPLLSTHIEALLWGEGTAPAWIKDRDLKLRLLQLFLQRLRPHFLMVDESTDLPATADPRLDNRADDDPWYQATLELLAWAATMADDELVIEAGLEGSQAQHVVVHVPNLRSRTVSLVHSHSEFLLSLPVERVCRLCTPQRLPALVELLARRFVAVNPERKLEYAVAYADRFLEQFEEAEPTIRVQALGAIVSRLTQTQKAAQADKGLKDEPLKDRLKRRRMRVNQDWRIHYSYVAGPGIVFETLGRHDLGIKP